MASQKTFTVFTKFAVKNGMTGPVLSMAKSADKLAIKAEMAKAALGKVGKFAMGAGKMIGGFALATGAAATAAGAAVFGLAKNSAQAADDISNTAKAIGLTTDALQQYRYLGIQAGLTTEEMDGALNKLTVNLGKNFEEVDAALYQIGLSAEGLKAAGPGQALEYIAQGFAKTTDPAKKAAVATAIFGKSSIRMVNALSKGAAGISDIRQEAEAIGYVMDGTALEAAGNLDEMLDKLGATATGAGNRIAGKFIPMVTKMVNGLQTGLQPGGKFAMIVDKLGSLGGGVGEFIGPLVDKALEFLPKLIGYVEGLWKAVQPIIKPILGMVEPVLKIFEGLIPVITKVVEFAAAVLGPILEAVKWTLEMLASDTGSGVRGYSPGTPAPAGASPYAQPKVPMSSQTAPMAVSSSTTTTSKVELSVAPGVNAKQDKAAPGVTLNTAPAIDWTPKRKR